MLLAALQHPQPGTPCASSTPASVPKPPEAAGWGAACPTSRTEIDPQQRTEQVTNSFSRFRQ